MPDPAFMEKVEALRVIVGKHLPVSSAARCPAHNAKVSKTGLAGPHTTGRAIDLAVRGSDAVALLRSALALGGFTGVGVAQKGGSRFLHLDDLPDAPGCPRPWIWSY